jgi:deazaflavin-dependent oxidoreductase (nitroreductase family)
MFRAPLIAWRMGLGPLLTPIFMVLATRGRVSGLPRYSVLEYMVVDGTVYISSGWGERAHWYRNILADPHVTTQTRLGTQGAIARRVTDAETFGRLYDTIKGAPFGKRSPVWGAYLRSWGIPDSREDFIAARERMVILALEPIDELPLPPLEADLTWVWGIAALGFLAGWLAGRGCRRRSG